MYYRTQKTIMVLVCQPGDKNQQHSHHREHLERRKITLTLTAQVITHHISRTDKQFPHGLEHGAVAKPPDVKEIQDSPPKGISGPYARLSTARAEIAHKTPAAVRTGTHRAIVNQGQIAVLFTSIITQFPSIEIA